MLGNMEAVMNNLCVRHLRLGRRFTCHARVHNVRHHESPVRSPPQPHRETRAAAGPIVDRDGTAVRFRDRFHKAETQPEPAP